MDVLGLSAGTVLLSEMKEHFQKYATRNFLVEKNSNTFRIKVSYMRYTQIAILRFIFVRCTLFICFTTSINWNGMCWVYNHTTIYMIMTIVFELIAFVQRNVTCVCNRISVGLIWILLSIASLNFFIIALFKENWWTLIFVIINGQQQKKTILFFSLFFIKKRVLLTSKYGKGNILKEASPSNLTTKNTLV